MAKRKPESATPAEGPASPAASPHYTVLARRYRPQQFSDLVGQEHVAQALVNALQSHRVAHAYLFTGARGVGKTSTARILAKALNCERGPTPTPCDECDTCRRIAEGDDVDVLEIDGASNRGIDEIREIRQNVQFRPSRSRHKIYIVDEVHMLTREAFNALLKTLEEPPPHVKFIFATTEVQKVPVTILSRCQRFDFAGISVRRIADQLGRIVASEGMRAEPEALELVARRAGGSMRDGESILDQLLAFGGETLTADQVHRLLGTAHDERITALAQAVLAQNPGDALALLNAAADEGLDLGELLNQMIEYWRDLMVVSCAGAEGQSLSVTSAYQESLLRQARSVPLDTILAGLDILVATKARFGRSSHHGRVLVEMALVRLGRLGDLVALTQLAQWLQHPAAATPGTSPKAAATYDNKPAAGAGAPAQRSRPPWAGDDPAKKKATVTGGLETPSPPPAPLTSESIGPVWAEVLSHLSPLFVNDLRKANVPAISGPNALVIQFAAQYNFQREQCQDPARVRQLEQALRQVTGVPWAVRIESFAETGTGEPNSAVPTEPSAVRAQPARESELPPLMRKAMEALNAQVVPGRHDRNIGQEDK